MESQLKQRLVGAAVLVALAVIFLPMLVKGPAPDSGVSDVPLKVPAAPQGDMQTRDLPLVVPDEAPDAGAVGMQAGGDGSLPTVDTAQPGDSQPQPPADQPTADTQALPKPPEAKPEPMLPATVASGDYAVNFGTYGSSVSADTVVARLRDARLPARREAASVDGKTLWRVRIGPYASQADAEIARIEAVKVGKQSGARVVALDAAEEAPATGAAGAAASSAGTAPAATAPSAPAKPVAARPAESQVPSARPAAAAGVGYAVQIGAFGDAANATKLRDRLRATGISAFTETVRTDKGSLTSVMAGPVVSRADADQLKAQVKAKIGIDGIVRAHP